MRRLIVACLILLAGPAFAGTATQLLAALASDAQRQSGTDFQPSAARGMAFFNTRRSDWSCASCHTPDPRGEGRHVVTGKAIAPMAPAANPERLTDRAKVDKWFRRNCRDVLGRACTSSEQADVVAYLLSLH